MVIFVIKIYKLTKRAKLKSYLDDEYYRINGYCFYSEKV